LLKKTLVVNSGVVLLGAVAGTYLTRLLAARHSGLELVLVFFTSGAIITIVANYLAFWEPLPAARGAVACARRHPRGSGGAAQSERARDGFREVLRSVRTLLDRIEDDSLHFSARLLGSVERSASVSAELHDKRQPDHRRLLLRLAH